MTTLPKFPGTPVIAWGNTIEPRFKTQKQVSENGMRKVLRKWIYPEYKLTCSYKVLTEDQGEVFDALNTVMGFFMEMQGAAGVFLWRDGTFNHMENTLLGIGDGKKTAFQLKKQVGAFIEPVLDVEKLGIAGTDQPYRVDEYGRVVFEKPVAAGTKITASYDYFWRVAFAADSLSFRNFYRNLWELKKMELVTVK